MILISILASVTLKTSVATPCEIAEAYYQQETQQIKDVCYLIEEDGTVTPLELPSK